MLTRFLTVVFILALLGACNPEVHSDGNSTAATSAAKPTLDGSFDVGSYELAMRCWGTGTPTVVYLHGLIRTAVDGGAVNAEQIPQLLAPNVRTCTYDRANVGASGKSTRRQTGADSVRDLERLLAAANVPPPYVLLGASFGGLLATMYTLNHPSDVRGLVLLDASLPDGPDAVEGAVGAENRTAAPRWQESLEHLDQVATHREAQDLMRIRAVPAIPLTYLAVKDIPLPDSYPRSQVVAAIREAQQAFVSRFSPGRLEIVSSSHYMEGEIPLRIAEEVRALTAQR